MYPALRDQHLKDSPLYLDKWFEQHGGFSYYSEIRYACSL